MNPSYPSPLILPIIDTFYADDTILLSTNGADLQARFTILESLAAQIGLTLNKDKIVLLLAKVKHKSSLGACSYQPNRLVLPFSSTS